MTLRKLSRPGWVKEYDNETDLKLALEKCLCGDCSIDGGYTLEGMLSTDCGCEYEVKD